MKLPVLPLLKAVSVACLIGRAFPVGASAPWPERPVKMIVTFAAGSANDSAARIFADALARKWGKPVVVEDKPGAEGSIGVGSFVSSQDDHTLLCTVAGSLTVTPLLIDKLPYDAERDLQAVAVTTAIAVTIAVNGDLPVHSIADLVKVLKSNSGKFAWAAGPSLPRYVFAAFLKRHDLDMNFVGYRDASQPQADLGEGRIQVLVTSLAASLSPVQTGKARFLAVINPRRAAISSAILQNCHRALPDNGTLLLIERVMPQAPDITEDDRSVAMSDLTMLREAGGLERTEAQYRQLLDHSGFAMAAIHPAGRFSVIEARARRP